MRLFLTNCPECHRLMVRSPERPVCKRCLERRYVQTEPNDTVQASNDTAPEPREPAIQCHRCGTDVGPHETYCLRCRLHFTKMNRSATAKLAEKLRRCPGLRGSGRTFQEASRSHVRDILPGEGRSKDKSFTPTTKYSS